MKEVFLKDRVERWFRVTAPIVTMILLVLLYNMLSQKHMIRTIISTLYPFLFSFLIAWLLNPMVFSISKKLKVQRWLATLIVVIMIVGIIVLMIMWFVPQLTSQFSFLSSYLPSIIPNISDNLEGFANTLNIDFNNSYVQSIEKEVSGVVSAAFSSGVSLISSSVSIVGGVVSTIFIGLMMLMAAVYILIDFDKLVVGIDKVVPKRMKEDFRFLKTEVNRVVVGYLRGLIIETIIVGALAYVAFLIVGIEGALLFGVIIGFTNIIPYFGPYIGAIPVSLFALTDSIQSFVIVAVIVIVVQQIDGIIIKPKVFGKTTDVHPSISIIAIILFGKIFGFIGVVFAIPIAGLTIIIIRFVYKKLLIKYPEILK